MSISNVGLPEALFTDFCDFGSIDPGSSSFLTLNSGASNPSIPNVPDQTWTVSLSGVAGDPAQNHLQIKGQASGPSPATIPIDIAPDGSISLSNPLFMSNEIIGLGFPDDVQSKIYRDSGADSTVIISGKGGLICIADGVPSCGIGSQGVSALAYSLVSPAAQVLAQQGNDQLNLVGVQLICTANLASFASYNLLRAQIVGGTANNGGDSQGQAMEIHICDSNLGQSPDSNVLRTHALTSFYSGVDGGGVKMGLLSAPRIIPALPTVFVYAFAGSLYLGGTTAGSSPLTVMFTPML